MFNEEMLPTVLRHSEIALLLDDEIRVLDRRAYPLKKVYVRVRNEEDCYNAIKDMVTQGGGPLELALRCMVLLSRKNKSLRKCAEHIASSRPTNKSMANTLKEVIRRHEAGEDVEMVVNEILDYYDDAYDKMSDFGKDLIQNGYGVLTTCFPEHSFILSCKKALMENKNFTVYVPETRPYLQGARLTLPSLAECGINCTLITDAMPAFFMREKKIDIYMTASDALLQDGSVVNKIGTLENAICAKYFNIPYYPFVLKSSENKDLKIEYRNKEEVLKINGSYITNENLNALYPAFDIIDSSLIEKRITKDGLI